MWIKFIFSNIISKQMVRGFFLNLFVFEVLLIIEEGNRLNQYKIKGTDTE